MNDPEAESGRDRWARLRFAIVGPVLAAPPARGALRAALERLAAQSWRHPITRRAGQLRVPHDRAVVLRRPQRDARSGRRAAPAPAQGRRPAARRLRARCSCSCATSIRRTRAGAISSTLDNLAVLIAEDPTLGPLPSYATLRRYMTAQGLRPGAARAGPGHAGRPSAPRTGASTSRCGASRRSTCTGSGIWTSTTARARSSAAPARGAGRCCSACSTIARAWPVTSSGIWTRRPRRLVHGLAQAIQKRGAAARPADRQRRRDAGGRGPTGAGDAGHRARDHAAVQPLPERQARSLLGPSRRPAAARCSRATRSSRSSG